MEEEESEAGEPIIVMDVAEKDDDDAFGGRNEEVAEDPDASEVKAEEELELEEA